MKFIWKFKPFGVNWISYTFITEIEPTLKISMQQKKVISSIQVCLLGSF